MFNETLFDVEDELNSVSNSVEGVFCCNVFQPFVGHKLARGYTGYPGDLHRYGIVQPNIHGGVAAGNAAANTYS